MFIFYLKYFRIHPIVLVNELKCFSSISKLLALRGPSAKTQLNEKRNPFPGDRLLHEIRSRGRLNMELDLELDATIYLQFVLTNASG
jgi:hypothetical protein